jgi:hypothetical protein
MKGRLMRRLFLVTALALLAAGCASAVYDSLDRRGVDAKTILADRVADARDDAVAAATKVEAAAAALSAAKGLDGPDLARQLSAALGASQDAAVAAQDLRLSTGAAGASGARYFEAWEKEITLLDSATERDSAAGRLKAQADAHRKLGAALNAASLRLSPALTLLNDEVTALRKSPTSGVAARSRAGRIDAAAAASGDAAAGLREAAAEAERFLAALNAAP